MWEYMEEEGSCGRVRAFIMSSQILAYRYEQGVYASLSLFKLGYIPGVPVITDTLALWMTTHFP